MKKLVAITGFILATSANLFAQEFGLKAGVNYSRGFLSEEEQADWSEDESLSYSALIGFSVGGSFEYAFTNNFSFATGINFSQKGADIKFESTEYNEFVKDGTTYKIESIFNVREKNTFNYVELPVMLKAGINIGNTKIYGLIGGSAGLSMFGNSTFEFTFAENETIDGVVDINTISETDSYRERTTTLNIGLVPGIGVEIGNMQLEATYSMEKVIRNNYYFFDVARANTLNVSVGYKFGKGKNSGM